MIQSYRNYDVEYDATTGRHIARSRDDGFHLVSRDKSRLTRAIDQLWDSLELSPKLKPIPDIDAAPLAGWIRTWMKLGCNPDRIDLDREFAAGQL